MYSVMLEDVTSNDVCPLSGKELCLGEALPAGSTRDDHNFSLEPTSHLPPIHCVFITLLRRNLSKTNSVSADSHAKRPMSARNDLPQASPSTSITSMPNSHGQSNAAERPSRGPEPKSVKDRCMWNGSTSLTPTAFGLNP
jgi:hypothetical protein